MPVLFDDTNIILAHTTAHQPKRNYGMSYVGHSSLNYLSHKIILNVFVK